MIVALAMEDDPRRDLVQRLVLVLAHVRRRERRRRRADARFQSDIALATTRFRSDCYAAAERWARAKWLLDA